MVLLHFKNYTQTKIEKCQSMWENNRNNDQKMKNGSRGPRQGVFCPPEQDFLVRQLCPNATVQHVYSVTPNTSLSCSIKDQSNLYLFQKKPKTLVS